MLSCLSYFLAAVLLGVVALLGANSAQTGQPTPDGIPTASASLSTCLPSGTKLTDVVSVSAGGANAITVEQTLNKLGAYCTADNKLVDQSGKEIRFYRLTGCWGNAPENYQEILRQQADDIAKLKQQYTVIEMTCNPRGLLIP
ncbi:MAG: hypothetical protein ACYDBJ_12940 [Aggregatilineales bacterium]